MQSLDYPGYKDATELDILAHLLTREQIVDYREVDWEVFLYELQGNGLENFVERIIPREETIRVLAFLRDNARDTVFKYDSASKNIGIFEKECARLIHKNLVESQRDQIHGDYLLWPRPNLQRIAQGVPFKPKMTKEDEIIIKHMPSYSHDIGAFPPEMVVYVAHEFTNTFMEKAAMFQSTSETSTMPPMSQAKYIDPMRYRLMQLADRYMYFDKEPAYQTLWAMGVMLKTAAKKYWCREKFADGIIDYLNLTQEFRNTKAQMDAAVAEIMSLSQPQLAFDIPQTTHLRNPFKRPTKPMGERGQKLVEELADIIQMHKSQIPQSTAPFELERFIIVQGDWVQGDKHVHSNTSPSPSVSSEPTPEPAPAPEPQQGVDLTDGTLDQHLQLFKEAMLKVQSIKYSETRYEKLIAKTYDWYAVLRLGKDLGLLNSYEEMIALMKEGQFNNVPNNPQNLNPYRQHINAEPIFPNWQFAHQSSEPFFRKFKAIADNTYSLYCLACVNHHIKPYGPGRK